MTEKTTHSDYKVRLPWFGLPRLVPFLKPYKGIVICMAVLVLLNGVIDICLPLFQQYAINNFIAKGTLQGLGGFIGLYVCVIALQIVFSMIDAYQACQIEMYVGRDLKRASFNHLQTLSFSYFNQNSVGYIHARVMSDTNRIGSIVAWGLMDTVWNLSYLVGVIVVMFVINWRLALWVVALTPVITLIAAFFQSKLTVLNRRVREINSQITGNFNEGITGAKTTKTLVVEEKMEQDFGRTTEDMRKTSIRTARYRATFISIVMFTASFAMALVLWRGGTLAMTSETLMQIGTLSVFMNYALGLMEPIQTLVRMISELINVQVNIERFTNLLATRSDVEDSPEVVEKYGDTFQPKRENWEPLHGDVEFQDVSFKYPDGEEYILEHFNLKVPQGTNVAIVGETGAGKSTLVNLVCRFFEPTKGRVLIDGRDARERSQLWLHSNIGYVLQTPHLFSGTVLENLRYGKPDATMEDRGRLQGRIRGHDHRPARKRLRQRRRRGRRPALHRRQAADLLCARGARGPAHLRPGRGHQLHRHHHRAPDPKRHRAPDEGPHLLCHRAPPLHHPPGGHHPGRGRGQDHRARHARGAHGQEGSLLHALHASIRAGGR